MKRVVPHPQAGLASCMKEVDVSESLTEVTALSIEDPDGETIEVPVQVGRNSGKFSAIFLGRTFQAVTLANLRSQLTRWSRNEKRVAKEERFVVLHRPGLVIELAVVEVLVRTSRVGRVTHTRAWRHNYGGDGTYPEDLLRLPDTPENRCKLERLVAHVNASAETFFQRLIAPASLQEFLGTTGQEPQFIQTMAQALAEGTTTGEDDVERNFCPTCGQVLRSE